MILQDISPGWRCLSVGIPRARVWFGGGRRTKAKQPMETVILEKTIIKIGTLLALGFGEAAAAIVGQNI